MKKLSVFLGMGILLILAISIFATAEENSEEILDGEEVDEGTDEEIKTVIDKLADKTLGQDIQKYIKKFVEKRGVDPKNITNISEVDFNSLPKEVNIENVGDHNLAIYEVGYKEGEVDEQVFVITYSVDQVKAQGDLIVAHDKRMFLNFGFEGEMSESGFLVTAVGVEGSLEKGYVMMREGSITGVSTSLNIVEGEGEVEVILYKNGEPAGFGNTLVAPSTGVKKDYDVQSIGVIGFEPGDVISAYVESSEGIIWEDVITLIEVTTK